MPLLLKPRNSLNFIRVKRRNLMKSKRSVKGIRKEWIMLNVTKLYGIEYKLKLVKKFRS